MWIAKTIDELRRRRAALEGTVVLVPTMGALHSGHLAHLAAGRKVGDHVLVSIFLNPAQFCAGEDLSRYPQPIEQDFSKCELAGVDGVFYPSAKEMYPPGQVDIQVTAPAMAQLLEGQCRPGHFEGVCRVVLKLLNIVHPDVATFGCKDYQQMRIIEMMVDDLNVQTRIERIATVRDDDGLAMSSRNTYLLAPQRRRAMGLYKALCEARRLVEDAGETDPGAIETVMLDLLAAHRVNTDYAVVRHPRTLAPVDSANPSLTAGIVALVAGRVDKIRLIDNMVLGAG